jgi:hypothetical protein
VGASAICVKFCLRQPSAPLREILVASAILRKQKYFSAPLREILGAPAKQ